MKRIYRTMQGEFATLETGAAQLRKFGLLVGGIILMIVGGIGLATGKTPHATLPAIGGALVFLALLYPRALLYPYYAWMGIAIVLGYLVGNVLLVILFYVFVTPIAILRKIFSRRKQPDGETYWIRRTVGWSKETMERLY